MLGQFFAAWVAAGYKSGTIHIGYASGQYSFGFAFHCASLTASTPLSQWYHTISQLPLDLLPLAVLLQAAAIVTLQQLCDAHFLAPDSCICILCSIVCHVYPAAVLLMSDQYILGCAGVLMLFAVYICVAVFVVVSSGCMNLRLHIHFCQCCSLYPYGCCAIYMLVWLPIKHTSGWK